MDITLNIFTLNCWAIPCISKNRRARINAISDFLSNGQYEIVCLQEIWSESDFLLIKNVIKDVLPYSHYFYSGVIGSGLCVFSKWLIEDVFFHQWSLNGYIHKIHHGDWFGGKGVGLCRIQYNDIYINVYCTHLHAEYHKDDIYLAHRVSQAYTTGEFVKLTSSPADIVILAGDLNTEPGTLSYNLITTISSLIDPGSSDNVNQFGTSNNERNTYSDKQEVRLCPSGKRIDHILYKTNSKYKADIVEFGLPLPSKVPDEKFSYSDHEAVHLKLKLIKLKQTIDDNIELTHTEEKLGILKQAIDVCKEAQSKNKVCKRAYMIGSFIILFVLLASIGISHTTIKFAFIRIILSLLFFYTLSMGTIWHRIEMNSLKGCLCALNNIVESKKNKFTLRSSSS